MRFKPAACLSFALCLGASAVHAASFESGVSVGIGIGQSSLSEAVSMPVRSSNPASSEAVFRAVPIDDDDISLSAFVAYDFSARFNVALGYSDLGEFEGRLPGGTPTSEQRLSLGVKEFSLSAQALFPMTEGLAAYLRLGVSKVQFDKTEYEVLLEPAFQGPEVITEPEDETGYLFGVGLQWRVHRFVQMSLGFSRHDVGIATLDTIGLTATLAL